MSAMAAVVGRSNVNGVRGSAPGKPCLRAASPFLSCLQGTPSETTVSRGRDTGMVVAGGRSDRAHTSDVLSMVTILGILCASGSPSMENLHIARPAPHVSLPSRSVQHRPREGGLPLGRRHLCRRGQQARAHRRGAGLRGAPGQVRRPGWVWSTRAGAGAWVGVHLGVHRKRGAERKGDGSPFLLLCRPSTLPSPASLPSPAGTLVAW